MNASVGQRVRVRWGYGHGYRAEGRGVVVAVFEQSVRVRLSEDVLHDGRVGWSAGFVLKQIPRYPVNPWDGIEPIEEAAA